MPTVLRKDGFQFFFYANEHMPKHVHVVKGDDYAKINIENLEIIHNYFTKRDTRKVKNIIKENQKYLLEKWDEWLKRKKCSL